MSKQKVILFGTGLSADLFYNQIRNEVEVLFCVDNSIEKQTRKFYKLSILPPIKENLTHYIIIATSDSYYDEIRRQLTGMGLKEFVNFCHKDCFRKKVVMLHGNCHTDILREYLRKSEAFSKNYGIYPNTTINHLPDGYFDAINLAGIDFFIHQDISVDNPFGLKVSDEYIIPRLNKNCIAITIPNLFSLGYGFFPESVNIKNERNECCEGDRNGLFPYGDKNIITLLEQKIGIDEIINTLKAQSLIPEEEVVENFNCYIEKIRRREKNWEIKILDYILEMYRLEKIFYNPGHPTNLILKEIGKRLLKYMGVFDEPEIVIENVLDIYEMPIYPSVGKVLGLQFTDHIIRNNGRKLRSVEMDFVEYIREYVEWSTQ